MVRRFGWQQDNLAVTIVVGQNSIWEFGSISEIRIEPRTQGSLMIIFIQLDVFKRSRPLVVMQLKRQ